MNSLLSNYNAIIGLVVAVFALTVCACLLAAWWAHMGTPGRFVPGVILSLGALLVGLLGVTIFQVRASRTVNGEVQWSFNSKYFFGATLVIAVVTLAYTLWRRRYSLASAKTRADAVPPVI